MNFLQPTSNLLMLSPRKRFIIKEPPRAIHFRNSVNNMNFIRNEIFVLANSAPRSSSISIKSRPLTQVQTNRKSSHRSPSLFSSVFSQRRDSISVHRKNKFDSEEELESFKADCVSYFIESK